ncbi:MAG: hypothetical protein GY754_12095 [bacterium]|nr:hypothetical protein [bacterium]
MNQVNTEQLLQKRMSRAIAEILNKDNDLDTLTQSLIQVNKVFMEISPVRGEESKQPKEDNILLPSGLAISPEYAALNLRDILRTAKYLRGLKEAIDSSLERFQGSRVHIIYAGCGPYGTLVLPLLTLYKPEQLKLTMLEVHPRSLDSIRNVCDALGFNDFLGGIIQEDAALYRHPADDPVHIVVQETMRHALQREPQVSISRNMAAQLVEGGTLIPEKVRVLFYSVDADIEFNINGKGEGKEKARQFLGEIFVLDKDCHKLEVQEGTVPFLQAAALTMPGDLKHGLPLMLFTEIDIFNNNKLEFYESGITHPYTIGLNDNIKPGDVLDFKYKLDSSPEFIYEKNTSDPWA